MKVTMADCFFGCLPLFHMAGQAFAASAVAGGASFVVVSRFSARRFWDQIYQSQATIFRHLGEMLAVLCQRPEHPREREHNLRAVYGGGARRDVAEAFERRFRTRVVEGYGLTETNTVLTNDLDESRPDSIGRMLPYSYVRIADDDGKQVPHGQVGEIQVRRNSVMMKGYLDALELTEEAFVDGWYRTGDLGYRDRDGYFYFVGRKKDIIRRRGENVAAAEVEEVLNRHPGVALSAVIGVQDRAGGEEIKAFVTLTPGADTTLDSLAGWCRASLAEFKVPRYFEMTPDLPQTPTNKVDKGLLRSEGTLGGVRYEVKPRKRGSN
jgi:acyl-CoA synthetase (AMP-forming)/AMP-acid ligase II